MAIAHPALGLDGEVGEQALEHRDGAGVLPQLAEGGGLEVAVARMPGIDPQEDLRLGEGLGGPGLAVEGHGEVVAGGDEAWRQLQAAPEEGLGVLVAAEPGGGLRQHAQGRRVVRPGLQPVPQEVFGHRQPALVEGRTRLQKARIAGCGAEGAGLGALCGGGMSQEAVLDAQRGPALDQAGVQGHRAGQGLHRPAGITGFAPGQSKLQVRRRPGRLGRGQGRQVREGLGGPAHPAAGGAAHEKARRVAGDDRQDLLRLRLGEVRPGRQEAKALADRGVEASLGHAASPAVRARRAKLASQCSPM